MLDFNYDPATRRYVGASEANPNPMRPGEFLNPPAFATRKPLPAVPPGHVAVFDVVADTWNVEVVTAPPPLDPAEGMTPAQEVAALRAAVRIILARLDALEGALTAQENPPA